jgi:hypothetical protein
VQLDTIHVVRRAHEHVLWTRVPDAPDHALEVLQAAPRRIVEYWAHAAAYLPLEAWRFCLPRMKRIRRSGHEWFDVDRRVVAQVRRRITAEGPLGVADFRAPPRRAEGWWSWKPAKIALEYLFHAGEVMAIGRRQFHKVYDLAERHLPPDLDLRMPTAAEMAAHHVDRAIASLGLFTRGELIHHRRDGVSAITAELAARVESGALVAVELEGRVHHVRPADLDRGAAPGPDEAFVLSPFDPLVLDRQRLERLFGFTYVFECYVPPARRTFGYFALPILHVPAHDLGDARFVGQVDATHDRRAGTLVLHRLRVERPAPGQRPTDLARVVALALRRYAAWNGSARIAVTRLDCEDRRVEKGLRSALAG